MYGSRSLHMQSSNLLSPEPQAPFPNMSYKGLVKSVLAFRSPQWCSSRKSGDHSCRDEPVASILKAAGHFLSEGLNLEDFTA
jgi:hypothetical protein